MRKVIAGACLCSVASGVAALSLGSSRGAVVLGSPIDLMFEVRPDVGNDLASSCLSARLVSGANTISDSRVQVTPVLGGAAPMVRVQARVVADEPVLTVTLAAGCEGRVTRTYTFLVDPPSAAPAVTATAQRPIDLAGQGAAAPRGAMGDADAAAPQRSLAMRASGQEGGDAPAAAGGDRRQARPVTPKALDKPARPRAAAPAQPPARLIVEPLDSWLDTPLALRLSRAEPLMISAPDEARRAQSAALWKTLNASPESLKESMALLGKLQADAAAQGKQLTAEKAAVAELRQRLEQAEAQGFSASWVYGLGGLLALAVGGIAWLLRRSRHEELQAWQHSVARSAASKNGAVAADGPDGQEPWQVEPDALDTWQPSTQPPPQEPDDHLPADAPDTVPRVSPAASGPAMAPLAQQAVRAQQIMPPDAAFDIQQQAEFFISIGEHEQAIEVLRAHIEEHGDAMPWAYLESLRLFHMLGRTEAFNRLSQQFQERFNVRVPGLRQFQNGGQTLEDYPEALARIEALWPSPEVMGVLDGLLFRRGGQHEAERFDLAAFDDLLLLLAIAQTTPAHLRGTLPRVQATPRANQGAVPAERSLDSIAGELSLVPSGYGLPARQPAAGLDVDLSQLRELDIASDARPVAAPAKAGNLGIGMDNDRLAFPFELDEFDRLDPVDKKRF